MGYIVFARKYRPQDFDEIIGQDHITTTLKNAIKQDRVAHAYLFSGPRGIGKTTTARILAKALNCEKGPTPEPCNKCVSCQEISSGISMDVIEIDGASNRGIDEIRQLRENVKFVPTHGRYKLYIIDEVHMLTQEAFNALLKTLEEPPPHVKFIFATTHPNKVIATVLSRCQKFDFRRIYITDIVSKLKEIAKDESIKVDDEALFSIARQAEGSLRDAESVLDQLNTFCNGKIKMDDITHILGTVGEKLLEELVCIIIKRDTTGALKFINRLINEGKDLSFFLLSLIEYFRNLIVAKLCTKPQDLINLAPPTIERLTNQSKDFSQEELFYISNILVNTYESIKRSTSVRVIFELAIVKITKRASLASLSEILDKIQKMEKKIASGIQNNVMAEELPIPPLSLDTENKEVSVELSGAGSAREEAAKKEEAPKAKPDTSDVKISKIQEIWSTLLRMIRTKKMSVASYLLEGSLVAFKDGILTIGFQKNYSLHKEALEKKENKLIIEEALRDILQNKIRVNFVTQDILKEESPVSYNDKSRHRRKETIEQDALKEPVIQSALEIFDGRIVKKNSPPSSGRNL